MRIIILLPIMSRDCMMWPLLHMDQDIITPNTQKKMIYEHFNCIITDISKTVINHGSPVYPEFYSATGLSLSDEEAEKRCIDTVRETVGENVMVVNSHTATSEREWGFGVPIVHGMDAREWLDLPKEPRMFTALCTGFRQVLQPEMHGRGFRHTL